MEERIYNSSDYKKFGSNSVNASGNGFSAYIQSGETVIFGFYIPVSEIPEYEYSKYEVSVLVSGFAIVTLKTGYRNTSGEFAEILETSDYNSDMLYEGKYITPCVQIQAPMRAVSFKATDFFLTVISGNADETENKCRFFLGQKPVEKIMLGGRETEVFSLGGNNMMNLFNERNDML